MDNLKITWTKNLISHDQGVVFVCLYGIFVIFEGGGLHTHLLFSCPLFKQHNVELKPNISALIQYYVDWIKEKSKAVCGPPPSIYQEFQAYLTITNLKRLRCFFTWSFVINKKLLFKYCIQVPLADSWPTSLSAHCV